jgi:cation diffusion facilitator family transporter
LDFVLEKKRAAAVSIISNSFLILSKLIVGIFSGSISIIAEATHSFADLLASIMAFFSVKISSEPADSEHPFGHGKFEDLSGFLEGILILGIAIFIVYEAVRKIYSGVEAEIHTTAGIIVMVFSVVINIFVSRYLFKTAHKTESMALLADAEHLKTDIYTSLGVLIALIIIKYTGFTMIDPVIAVIAAIFITKTACGLCFAAAKNLLDTSLPDEERIIIGELVENYIPDEIVEIKELKTRKAGAKRVIEMILAVPEDLTIKEGHDLCDRIEEDIEKKIGNVIITIHLEPC